MEQDEERRDYIECRTYTHARRHPFVIGTINGWHLPTPLTPTQLAVFIGTFFVTYQTSKILGTSGALNILLILLVPIIATWAVRHLRVEGRSPIKFLIGWVTYQLHPRKGVMNGKPVSDRKPQVLTGTKFFITELPEQLAKSN